MHLIFSDQAMPDSVVKSLFLAGPSPRNLDMADWRHDALAVLEQLGFDGTVFLPVPSYRFNLNITDKDKVGWSYDDQVEWECEARKRADIIVFWIPRVVDRTREDLGMPAFTTNFEMGEDLHSNKLAYGRPATATKNRYLDKRVAELGQSVHAKLENLFVDVMACLGDGALRTRGETCVPLFVWRSAAFQSWYTNLCVAGNRLDDATMLSSFVVGGKFLLTYQMKVKIWVAAENRHKSNEFIFARPDISAVVACHRGQSGLRVVLVREFRSTVNNDQGYVFEMPGGSSAKPGMDPQVNASHELAEETGLEIADPARFVKVGQRQLVATLSTHQAQVYGIELNAAEFAQLEQSARNKQAHGVVADTECTFVEIASIDELFALPVDYATLGMVFEALRTLDTLPA